MNKTKRTLARFGAAGLMLTTGHAWAQGAHAGGTDPAGASRQVERTTERTTERTVERPVDQPTGAANGQVPPSQTDQRDAALEHKVEQRFSKDKQLAKHDLQVDVTSGTATLRGSVPSSSLKERAEQMAGQVKGVEAVENLIEVQTAGNGIPPSPRSAEPADDPMPAERLQQPPGGSSTSPR